jgi:hypothetical protein
MKISGEVHSKSEHKDRPGMIFIGIQIGQSDVFHLYIPAEKAAEVTTGQKVVVEIIPEAE